MDLKIRGGNAFQKNIIRAAVTFAKKELLPRHRTLDVTVRIRKFTRDEGNVVGWCNYEDASDSRPREFFIEVSPDQGLEYFIKTTLHEMVHVKQYARCEMRESYSSNEEHRIYWKGTDHTKTAYSKSPWEKEAYRMQDKLYNKFMNEVI